MIDVEIRGRNREREREKGWKRDGWIESEWVGNNEGLEGVKSERCIKQRKGERVGECVRETQTCIQAWQTKYVDSDVIYKQSRDEE